MALELSLFKNYTPNISDTTYIVPSSKEALYNYLKNGSNFIKTLTLDNYRINTNVIRINLTNDLLATLNNITYAIEATYEGQTFVAMKCWHVKEVLTQSGYIILDCEIDLWQTYINDVTFDNTTILRTNKNYDGEVGFYDPIDTTEGDMTITRLGGSSTGGTEYGLDYLWAVFLVEYNISQAVFGTDKISRTELYGINLQDLYALADVASGQLGYRKPPIDIVISIMGGIYKVSANVGNNDAQILNAWIVPNECLNTAGYGITLTSKSVFFENSSHEHSFDVELVLPNAFTKKITISNYNINRVYYGGTFNNGLKLMNNTNTNLEYNMQFITTDDEIKVIAQQGERQQDVTNGFAIKLTTNGAQKTELRRVAEAFSTAVSAEKSMISNFASGTASFGGIGGGISQAGLGLGQTIANMVNPYGIESARGNGDGYLSYWNAYNNNWRVKSPFVITTFDASKNQIDNARKYGANYSIHIGTINPFLFLQPYPFLQERPLLNITPYVKAITTAIGAPLNACTFISNAIKNGIHYNDTLV